RAVRSRECRNRPWSQLVHGDRAAQLARLVRTVPGRAAPARIAGAKPCAPRSALRCSRRFTGRAACAAPGGPMKLRWMLGCMVQCLVLVAACRPSPPTIPGATPGNPQGVCRQTQVTGTRIPGATLVHGATFYMLMIDTCGTDLTQLAVAARACQDRSECGQ